MSLSAPRATAPRAAIAIRSFSTPDDYQACLALQKETWGNNFAECVPPSLLLVSQKIGGIAAGAFDDAGHLLGFVFGLTGVRSGRLVHWSDMLAVRPEWRDQGLGRRLKLYQKERALALGVEVIYWSFDPLVARNAHLNLNRLGARVEEYVPDMYREDSGGTLHQGMSLDRFIVAWVLRPEQEKPPATGDGANDFAHAPIVNTVVNPHAGLVPAAGELALGAAIRIEIPADIQVVKASSMEQAATWRAVTRRAFLFYQERGYKVAGFRRHAGSGRCFYQVVRD